MRRARPAASSARMDVLLEHHEFVAAEPRHEILGPQHLAQPFGHRAQQLVAAGMAERVVDLLELVEIDEQQRRQLFGALLGRQQLSDLVAEIDPVGQRREFVVARQMADPGFRVLAPSVMSSTSMTVPPPAIGWNVHDSARSVSKSGSVVMISLAANSRFPTGSACRSPPTSFRRRRRPRRCRTRWRLAARNRRRDSSFC